MTESRVDAVLDFVMGDIVAFITHGILSRARAVSWLLDLADVLKLEAVACFQLTLTLPDGKETALEYRISDDGRLTASDNCGGFSTYGIPADTRVGIVISWRANAHKKDEAQKLLHSRGWGPSRMVSGTIGSADRKFCKDGYGFDRRTVGEWPV